MTASEFRENLLVSLDTLRAHKVRSALTLLGIVIGVTSVIAVASIIDGLNRFVQQRVEQMGSRTYFVMRFPFGVDPQRMPEKIRMRKFIDYETGAQLRELARPVEAVTVMGTRAAFFGGEQNEIRYGGEKVNSIVVRGADPYYTTVIPMFNVEHGRFFTEQDERSGAAVCVLGSGIAESLFPSVDPIGKTVLLNGQNFEVIGTFTHDQGMGIGMTVDQFVVIPLSNFRKHNPQAREAFVGFSLRRDANKDAALAEVNDALRRIRRLRYDQENDFEINSSDMLTSLWNQLTGAIVVLTGVICSIGLLVGGIGVMNIMLISVTERTMEIGIRKAIGARQADIRVQFLLEAVTLTGLGGVIGVALGGAIAWTVRTFAPSIPAALSMFWVVLGVAIAGGVGLFFGFYPANRAARLDPIVCLRYE